MSNQNGNDIGDTLDRAVANRLARLGGMPVDTTRLEHLISAQIPRPRRRHRWLRPVQAIAAGLIVLVTLAGVFLTMSGGPVLASTTQMAQMHEDLVAGRTPVMRVSSIEEANKLISEKSPQAPAFPGVPADHVMACCMKDIKNKKVACVLLEHDGVPITLVTANASDMRLPTSPTIQRDGVTYHVQSIGSLSMVMTERHKRWICMISKDSAERLVALAEHFQF